MFPRVHSPIYTLFLHTTFLFQVLHSIKKFEIDKIKNLNRDKVCFCIHTKDWSFTRGWLHLRDHIHIEGQRHQDCNTKSQLLPTGRRGSKPEYSHAMNNSLLDYAVITRKFRNRNTTLNSQINIRYGNFSVYSDSFHGISGLINL